MSETLTTPALIYPERQAEEPAGWLDRAVDEVVGRAWKTRRLAPDRHFAERVLEAGERLAGLCDSALPAEAAAVGRQLRQRGEAAGMVAAFALVREAAGRTLGARHFPVQLMAGRVLLTGGIAEMETGEGKTLTATLAAATAALGGAPVHIITANDYLAARDADWMRPVYAMLGLEVGMVVQGVPPAERRRAYAAPISYCSNKEVAFDYLRDRLAMGARGGNLSRRVAAFTRPGSAATILPGLSFAIVDEADSVLIDEARTPLILSETPENPEEAEAIGAAVALARRLHARHYDLRPVERGIDLTAAGEAAAAEGAHAFAPEWRPRPIREELVRTALAALHLHHRGEHYLVMDDKIGIVDEYTGRIMPDRAWGSGLHQAVEIKEGLAPTPRRRTIAQITFQRFFRRYRRLAGMTGTAAEASAELWSVYRLPVVRIPTNRPLRRRDEGTRILPTAAERWAEVARVAATRRAEGRPVLIGTRTVAASAAASAALDRAGVPHRVLSAAQDAEEAAVVAAAGEVGAVTVATNMAGRGTDIRLVPVVAARGGLHVILTERSAAHRIDRQLIGRAGRQGDPGSYQALLSREDALLDLLGPGPARRLGRLAFDLAQRRAERAHARARRRLLRHDDAQAEALAFTGPRE